HRQLFRDFDLVAVDPVEWNAGEHLLPLGRWREKKSAIARGHAACVLEGSGVAVPSLPIPSFKVQTVIDGVYQGSQPVSVETLRGRSGVAFAGIAKPERFFSTLQTLGLQPSRCVVFRDHHAYTKRDIEALGDVLKITTEKDVVRLEEAGIDGLL